jgi:hypothetical protein
MPKERAPDRERIYRLFLKERIRRSLSEPQHTWRDATDAEVVAVVQRKRNGWFDEAKLESATDTFNSWYPVFKKRVLKDRALKAASTRWTAKKLKNPLVESVKQSKKASSTKSPATSIQARKRKR